MDSIEFVNHYDHFLCEIRDMIKPDLYPQLDELAKIDPHDLESPETWFPNENVARGFIWSIFVSRVKKIRQDEQLTFFHEKL